MKCEYCGTDNRGAGRCTACGAKLHEKAEEVQKYEPFFYNGYICYQLFDPATEICEVQFWLGRELIERIAVSRDLLRARVPESWDAMSFFWDLFLVAHGETEVLEWQEKNKKYPARFEVRRFENPDKERLHSLSLREIVQEYR
jgi:hypothetical protein